MAMDPGELSTQLTALFSDPPETEAEVRDAWADAIADFTENIVPPVYPPAAEAAKAAFKAALVGMSESNQAPTVIGNACGVHATALAAGMTPPGIPPASAVALTAALTLAWGTPTDSVILPVTNAVQAIYAYYLQGLSGAPGNPPWS